MWDIKVFLERSFVAIEISPTVSFIQFIMIQRF